MLNVAVGILKNDANQLLMSMRTSGPFKGYWEFPGGKIEDNESPQNACCRELREELGVTVNECNFIGNVEHAYSDKKVSLSVFLVNHYQGLPKSCEKQMLKWFDIKDVVPSDHSEGRNDVFLPPTYDVLLLIRDRHQVS